MLAKRLLQKATHHQHHHHREEPELLRGNLKAMDFDPQIISHYGIPSTASILAIDPIQRLIAIGTLDGRIKVIGGCNIECLFISPKQLPYKYLKFLENQGFLVGITTDNEIEVWNLERRCIDFCLHWESNIVAFYVIFGSPFMFVLNELGVISVLKYVAEDRKLMLMPYNMSTKFIAEKAGFLFIDEPVVGILPQPLSFGNRVLIAYQNGLIILWDISDSQVVCVRGDKDLEVKVQASDFPIKSDAGGSEDVVQKLDEKEISAVCWASSLGNILAVGYTDGDILLWNMAINSSSSYHHPRNSSKDIVKLQLSSADKRFPIITLHWAGSSTSKGNDDGKLFIYGGVEIGSEEVVTVVSVQWSPGRETLSHARRVDLSLMGSFSDMILLSSLGLTGSDNKSGLFVLSSPGKLQYYDDKILLASVSQPERNPAVPAIEFPMVVPTLEPHITATKLISFTHGLSHLEFALTQSNRSCEGSPVWPLNGGIPSFVSSAEIKKIKRVYVTGHQDGSVRIYDASSNVFSLMSLLGSEVYGIELSGSNAPVSVMNFCAMTMTLAVGNEKGLVYIYSLKSDPDMKKIHVFRDSKREVHELPQGRGLCCSAIFHLVSSRILSLQFSESGAKLAVGHESSDVAVLDVSSLSVIFLVNLVSESKHPVVSLIWKTMGNSRDLPKGQKQSALEILEHPTEEQIYILTRDGLINIIDGSTGNRVSSQPLSLKKELKAISLHVLEGNGAVLASSKEKLPKEPPKNIENADDQIPEDSSRSNAPKVTESLSIPDERLLGSLVLVCFENSLRMYAMKSVFQGKDKPIHKVELQNACCWTATLNKEDKVCGLVLLYQTGTLEIRSLPDLEVVAESSLKSILRWNFRPNMDRILSSDENGQIIMVNGCELASISLLANEDYFRAVESVPCLHDTVLAAAVDAAITSSLKQRKQAVFPGLIGGIVKGFKKDMPLHTKDSNKTENFEYTCLDNLFSRDPPTGSPSSAENKQIQELNIDDIVIDDPVPVASASSDKHKPHGKGPGTDKERLLEGATVDTKPRLRTAEEIRAKYRKTAGDGTMEAERARNKLLERQEKLERLSKRTEELRDGAEDFASLASELVKTMEARKWWQI